MSFEKGLKKLLEHEGYYSNDPRDHGGETYAGISRKWFPKWKGFRLLDTETYQDNELHDAVSEFYLVYFWYKMKCDLMEDEFIASMIFGFSVNLGKRQTTKKIQRILKVKQDGILGNITINALNNAEPSTFVYHFLLEVIEFYLQLGKDQPHFLRGWLNRAVSYYYDYEKLTS